MRRRRGVDPEPAALAPAATASAANFPSLARTCLSLLIFAVVVAVSFTLLGAFSTVQDAAKAELRLSDVQLSLVQGLAAAIPLALLSMPIGIMVDRSNRLRLMTVMAGVWTLGTVMTAYAGTFGMLFVARMLASVGVTGALTATISIASDLCPPALRGRAVLILSLGQRFGIAAAFTLSGWLVGRFNLGGAPLWFAGLAPWRSVHLALGIMSAILCLPLLLLREPARHEVAAGPHAPFRVVSAELWARRRFLVPLFAGMTSVVMADTAAVIWAAPILSRSYGLKPEQFAGWIGILLFAAGVAGAIFGGVAADLGQKSGRRGGILAGAVIVAAISAPAGLFPIAPNVPTFGAALGLLAFGGTVTGLITAVAMTVLLPNELRGFCIGAFLSVAGLIGYGLAPSLVTWVSLLLGGEAHLAPALAIVGTSVGTIGVVAFALAWRAAPDPIR